MAKLTIHPQQAAILAAYWPYQVTAHWALGQPGAQEVRVKEVSGLLKRLSHTRPGWLPEAYLAKPAGGSVNLLGNEVLLELYALQDLPGLSARGLEQVVRRLSLWGSRYEQYVTIHVLDSWLNHLTLEVKAGDFHHEVKLSSWGDVWARNVREDRRAAREADWAAEKPHWWAVPGQYALAAYELLRELHVAVGPVADCQQSLREGQPYGEPAHYVRKALPGQEGGPADG